MHLLPTLSLIIVIIPFYSLLGVEKVYVFQNDGAGYQWQMIYQNVLVAVSGLIYSALSLFLIQKHRVNIQQNFSNTDKKELRWLQYLSIGLGLIWILSIFFDSVIIFSGVVIFVLFIGVFGINQLNIFNTRPGLVAEPAQDSKKAKSKELAIPTSKRYAKSGLSKEMAEQLYSNLNQLMNEESLYKENDLTLTELAKRLGAHPNHLSQAINEKQKKNFYHYINSLRIDEFIRLAALPSSKQYTLLGIAYDCGFNSKSSFNKQFKEQTGKTPSEFLKTINS